MRFQELAGRVSTAFQGVERAVRSISESMFEMGRVLGSLHRDARRYPRRTKKAYRKFKEGKKLRAAEVRRVMRVLDQQ